MPRTKRSQMKRKLAQAYYGMDNALLDIKQIHNIFLPVHPELAQGLELSMQSIIIAQQLIEQFSLSAWNCTKESMMKYRQ